MSLRWTRWNGGDIAYFCWRMAPKLIELPEFNWLPEPALYPCRSCIRQWEDALITILSWTDNDTPNVSKEFEDFYNGLLYFRNAFDSMAIFSQDGRLQRELLAIVFEIYGSDPRVLSQAVDHTLSLWKLVPRDVREATNTEIKTMIWQENTSAPFGVQTLRRELYPKFLGLSEGPVGCPFEEVKRIYSRIDIDFLCLPMASGFHTCVRRAFHLCRTKLWDMIIADCQTRDVSTISDKSDEDSKTESRITVIAGPSGCGKTHQLLQLLKSQWGLYLLPGCLPLWPSATPLPLRNHPSLNNNAFSETGPSKTRRKVEDEALFDELSYRARRSGGSRDTQTWYYDIKGIDRNGFHCWTIADRRIRVLLKIRLGVLQDFLDPAYRRASPADWLRFQTSFDDKSRDIFNDLFRIARLSLGITGEWKWPISERPPPAPELRDLSVPRTPEEGRDEKLSLSSICSNEPGRLRRVASNLLICIDEAQCDFQDMFQGRPHHGLSRISELRSFHPFSCIMRGAASEVFATQDSNNVQMVISGTALQLESTLGVVIAEIPEIQGDSFVDEECKRCFALKHMSQEIMERFIKEARENYKKGPNLELWLCVEGNFRFVDDDSRFKELLMEKIPDCNEKLQNVITEHSRPLRGRYSWSVCYVKEIRRIIKQKKEMDPQSFNEEAAKCCQRVYVAAKEGLKSRLEDIDGRSFREISNMSQNWLSRSDSEVSAILLTEILARQDQQKKMLDELCWLAIRSDLLGSSIIFQSKESEAMVTLGFAFAENTGPGGTKIAKRIILKERIAVEAAVEYFQAQRLDGKSSRYDDALKRSFYQEQDNLSALGKKAELFFAWHLKKVLRTPGQHRDAVLPAFSRRERMKVLNLLVGQAKNVEELLHGSEQRSNADIRSKVQFGCDLDQLCLIEGAQTAFQEKSHGDRPETMWGWLKMIREGDPGLKSAFWFPSEKAGPDVVFALRRTASHCDSSPQIIESGSPGPKETTGELEEEPRKIDNSIILCVVQIKRQAANRDIPGAILSTSPNHWFRQGTKSEAKNILQELNQWSKAGHLIVRILVTSLTDPPTDNPKKTQPKEYLQEEMAESPTWEKLNPNFQKTKGKSRKAKGKSRKTKGEYSKLSAKDGSKDFEGAAFPLNQQYFNWIGVEHDGDLFGSAFEDFREAEKNA